MTMTKLKLAATVGVSLAIAGSAPFVTRAQNPTSASAPGTTAITSTAPTPTAASGPLLPNSSGNATLASLNTLQLSRPFTLTFRQEEHDVRDSDQKAREFKEQQNNYNIMVEKGQLTRQLADQILSQMAPSSSPFTPIVTTVTLSADGGKLLYHSQGIHPEDDIVVITDGNRVFQYSEKRHKAEIYTGLRFFPYGSPCPLPGVGVPFLPLIKGQAISGQVTSGTMPPAKLGVKDSESLVCDVVDFPSSYNTLTFSPGVAKVRFQEGQPQITSVAIIVGGETGSTWAFSDYRPFQGLRIASNALWTSYEYNKPAVNFQFTLLTVKAEALAPKNFQEETWLPRGTRVIDHTGPTQVGFNYDPNKGDLKHQKAGAVLP